MEGRENWWVCQEIGRYLPGWFAEQGLHPIVLPESELRYGDDVNTSEPPSKAEHAKIPQVIVIMFIRVLYCLWWCLARPSEALIAVPEEGELRSGFELLERDELLASVFPLIKSSLLYTNKLKANGLFASACYVMTYWLTNAGELVGVTEADRQSCCVSDKDGKLRGFYDKMKLAIAVSQDPFLSL